jgi:outer membrane protein OmpA-like peptidoglycan-associated protein
MMRRGIVLAVSAWLLSAVPAASIKQFIVFFPGVDADRLSPRQWEVTSEGRSVIADFASAYKELGGFVLLAGHDENASTFELSYARSERRAEAVKTVLVELGVPRGNIAVKACAFSRPLGNAVGKEPMNRYVIFDWHKDLQMFVEAEKRACPEVHAPVPK